MAAIAETLTLQEVSGQSFRLAMKDGSYRDFHSGFLVVLPEDPLRAELLEWAGKQANISIIESGAVKKTGTEVCPVCGRPVAERDMADHMAEVHVDEPGIRAAAGLEPKEEPAPRRRRR